MRSRLHRWCLRELQEFVAYKAEGSGIGVLFVNPAYSSRICSQCACMGSRKRHVFTCSSCGSTQHSDCNAAINLLRLGETKISSTAPCQRADMVAVV